MKAHYRTIVVSDVHLGMVDSKARELVRFLRHSSCDTLVLNGDIIDGWRLAGRSRWKGWGRKQTSFVKLLLKLARKGKTRIVYVRGNHDDFLEEILPLEIGPISIVRDFVLESGGKRYLVLHGDIFDRVTAGMRWLAHVGDVGYVFLLWLNRQYNRLRVRRGLPYASLSRRIKQGVKAAVSHISDYERGMADFARARRCDGVICGHIHQAENRMIEDVHYLNSGDWVETLSALVETEEGRWSVVQYDEWDRDLRDTADSDTVVIEAEPRLRIVASA